MQLHFPAKTTFDELCRIILTWSVDPSSNGYYRWLGVISFAVLYNLILIIARSVFWKLQDYYIIAWLTLDYVCDVIYLIDIFVQFRTGRSYVTSILYGNIALCSLP